MNFSGKSACVQCEVAATLWPNSAAVADGRLRYGRVIVVAAAAEAGYDTPLTSAAFAVRRCVGAERERNVDGQ